MNLLTMKNPFSKTASAKIDTVVDKVAPLVRPAIIAALVGTYAITLKNSKSRHDDLLAEI